MVVRNLRNSKTRQVVSRYGHFAEGTMRDAAAKQAGIVVATKTRKTKTAAKSVGRKLQAVSNS